MLPNGQNHGTVAHVKVQMTIEVKICGLKTPAMMQVMHKEIPGSEYAEVPGTAHMLQVEEPEKFHAEVLPFFARTSSKTGG